MDSLSIFHIIDSLFAMEQVNNSELNIRAAFTSSVTSAGRDYDLNQTGISPGVSYYHKSGAYADLAGYWNSGITPKYNPTVVSFGYLGSLSTKWSYSLDYEKWIFNPNDSSENPLTNSIGGSLSYDLKFAFASIDYSMLFGDEIAHRLIGNLASNIKLGKWWVFKSVNLYPSASILYGNSDITQMRITREQLNDEAKNRLTRLIEFSELTDQQRFLMLSSIRRAYENGRITLNRRNELRSMILNASTLSAADVDELQSLINDGFDSTIYEDGNAFGLLNYSFSLPISFSTNRINVILSYTYSIPVSLPGEILSVNPIGYFGASISYRIPLN